MAESKRAGKKLRRLQVNVEVEDPEIAELFLRYKTMETMPSNAATGLKIFTELLRAKAGELARFEPARR